MISKVKIVVISFLAVLCTVTSGAKAATINVVDTLPYIFGSPIDWENINGTYDIFPDDEYDVHYDSDDFAGIIPPASLADLTAVWSIRDGDNLIELNTFVLTDDLGAIIDQEFWIAIACHAEYVLEITSRWIKGPELISNPLPPSVVVFMSAMFGLGYLARRRRIKKS